MISNELKKTILSALNLDDWELDEQTTASQVPGWDSLNHVNVIVAVEKHFQVRFSNLEVLRLKNVGDLQRLVDSKTQQRT
ncbi:MAG: acyl carrier protein [Candidatus Acidiferrales bacterium]